MAGEAPLDRFHHHAGDAVGREAARLRDGEAGGQAAAVLGVEVPAPAGRRVALHQQSGVAAHLAVEELQAELFGRVGAPFPGSLLPRPVPEPVGRTEEAVVVADLDRQAGEHLPPAHVPQHAPLAGVGADDARGPVPLDGPRHLAREGAGVLRVLQPHVLHPHAAGRDRPREVAHGGEHQRDLLLVVADVGAFGAHLGEQHDVVRGIEVGQRGQGAGALVAQHHAQRGGARHRVRPARTRRCCRPRPWCASRARCRRRRTPPRFPCRRWRSSARRPLAAARAPIAPAPACR